MNKDIATNQILAGIDELVSYLLQHGDTEHFELMLSNTRQITQFILNRVADEYTKQGSKNLTVTQ